MTLLQKQQEFATRLALMKHEAGTLELWQTMHAMDHPVVAVGFEIGAKIAPATWAQGEKYKEKRFA